MKYLALILMIFALANTAQASEENASLFTCGVNFGGKQLTFHSQPEEKSKRDYRRSNQRMDYVMGVARTEPARLTLPQPANASKTEIRLPPKVTFAIIGCSWR